MATFDNDLRLKEITTGDEDGTWGTSTNTNLALIADAFSLGTKQMAANADETFTMPNATADGIRSIYLTITSAVSLTATRTVTLAPNTVSKVWIIENATTGSQHEEREHPVFFAGRDDADGAEIHDGFKIREGHRGAGLDLHGDLIDREVASRADQSIALFVQVHVEIRIGRGTEKIGDGRDHASGEGASGPPHIMDFLEEAHTGGSEYASFGHD